MSTVATVEDARHMRRALALAEGGRGRVSPNPLVGAVLVRDGEVIGEGFHAVYGGLHAERAALEDCASRGRDPAGATLYVTLEPCAHHGKQPPCTEALIAARISRVVAGCEDPAPTAGGRGPGMLRDEGVELAFCEGAEAAAARLLIQPHRKHARTGRPLVVFKSASSLDGRVAATSGESRWISGMESRRLVHSWRGELDAVAVGIGTALADDPMLTVRDADGGAQAARQPARVVFDTAARLPLESALVRSAGDVRLIVVVGPSAPSERAEALGDAGAELVVAAGDQPADRVVVALTELGRRNITSVLLEGGPGLAGAFLDAGEIDELRLFIAPIVLGGREAPPLIAGEGADAIVAGQRPLAVDWRPSGDDMLCVARLREW